MGKRQHDAAARDKAAILLDRLHALASLLAVEEVATAFSDLGTTEQVALFGLCESLAVDVRACIAPMEVSPHE